MSEQDIFYNNILDDIESGALVLPTLPEVALQVREVVDDPNATAAQLADIIVTDAALSARLLKVANSPLYRGRVPIESIQMAVSRLGLSMVRNLVTSLVMEQMFQATTSRLDKRLRELWEHTTKVAATSQVLASKISGIKTDEAMLAGLIHAIGILPILMKADEDGDLIRDDRKLDQIIDNLYPKLGATILKNWKFSPELIEVAAEHKNLNRNTLDVPADLVDVVQVAVLQSYNGTDKAVDPVTLNNTISFQKVGADTGFSIEELDEDSEEYQEALALFNM
ncbi:putative signal transduction protein [Methylophaga thiooxydans]|uniref:Putative signal transduction protein n=1 Tax=Methylophaga thiooxydans TaxID=392484 RepID=A0A0A0BFH1_9GAMM|nr:HDOD domain-containing protein [Methylophaga thiooxydans]KGM07243.1 putative signal transduction protein [Methylophaga thiooxydans]